MTHIVKTENLKSLTCRQRHDLKSLIYCQAEGNDLFNDILNTF